MLIRSIWLFLSRGGPLCGCPHDKSRLLALLVGVDVRAPDFWKLPHEIYQGAVAGSWERPLMEKLNKRDYRSPKHQTPETQDPKLARNLTPSTRQS